MVPEANTLPFVHFQILALAKAERSVAVPFRSETVLGVLLQGYLAQKKYPPPWTLQEDCTQGHMVVLVGGAISCERGTPVYEASGPSELVDRSLWR